MIKIFLKTLLFNYPREVDYIPDLFLSAVAWILILGILSCFI